MQQVGAYGFDKLTHRPTAKRGGSIMTVTYSANYFRLPFDAFVGGIAIVKKSDPGPVKTVIRMLPYYQYKTAGTHLIPWNKKDDDGNTLVGTDYEAVVVFSNITDNWYVVGNTATYNHGASTFAGYSRWIGVKPSGNKLWVRHSWDEGSNMVGLWVDRTSANQEANNILYTPTLNHTNVAFEFCCTTPNGKYAIYGGQDPANGNSIVYAIDQATGLLVTFTAGVSYSAGAGITYPNAINVVTGAPANQITGLICNNDYLYVLRGSQNTIDIHQIETAGVPDGTLLSTQPFTNPVDGDFDPSNGGRIWFFNGTTTGVTMCTIGVGGALTVHALNILNFPANKKAMAIDRVRNILAIAVAGSTQQVWGWDISAATPTYGALDPPLFKHGQLGGMQPGVSNAAIAANDKFTFTDGTTGLNKGLNNPYLAYDDDSNLYVGDVGNNRCQVFDDTLTYVKTYMKFPAVYGVSADMTNPLKVYVMGMEFDVNPADGSWTFSRNFQAQIDAVHYSEGYDNLKYVSTLSNGRTYGTMVNYSTYPPNISTEIVELTDDGLRYTGILINDPGTFFGNYLDSEFTIHQIQGTYAVGDQPLIKKKRIDHFDGINNPVWGAWETVTPALQPIAVTDELIDAGNASYHGITTNGIIVIKNKELYTTAVSHLGGYSASTGNKMWSVWRPTSRAGDGDPAYLGHRGQYPLPYYYERGNGVLETYTDVQVLGKYIITWQNNENFKSRQTNYGTIRNEQGVVIRIFGTDRWKSDAIEPRGIKSSGNTGTFRAVMIDDDTMLVMVRDEGLHGGGQMWVFTGMSSVNQQTVQLNPPTSEPVEGTNQLDELTAESIFADTAHITRSDPEDAGFKVQTNIMDPDKDAPDLYLQLVAAGNEGLEKDWTRTIYPAYDPLHKSYKVTGRKSLMDYFGNEPVDEAGVMFQILDDAFKVISQIGTNQFANYYKLRLNDHLLINTNDSNIVNNFLADFQNFVIIVNSLGCKMSYANYTPIFAGLYDPTADWSKPTYLRVKGKSISSGEGMRALSIANDLQYVEILTDEPAPLVTDLQTLSSNEIQITFDRAVSGSELGFTPTADGIPLTVDSFVMSSITPNIGVLTLINEMANGQVLKLSYDDTIGDVQNASPVKLASFTDLDVTNNIAPPNYAEVSYVQDSNGGFNLSMSLPAFNLIAGNSVEIGAWNYPYAPASTPTDTAGNLYTKHVDDNGVTYWKCDNCIGNAANVITINFGGFTAFEVQAVQSEGIAPTGSIAFQADGLSSGSEDVTSNNFTTLNTNQVVTCMAYNNGGGATWTVPAGYTAHGTGTGGLGRISLSYKWYTSIQTGINITATTVGDFTDKTIFVIGRKLA